MRTTTASGKCFSNMRLWSRCGMVFVCVFYTRAGLLVQVFFSSRVFVVHFCCCCCVVLACKWTLKMVVGGGIHIVHIFIFHLRAKRNISHTCRTMSCRSLSFHHSHTVSSSVFFLFSHCLWTNLFLDVREINKYAWYFSWSVVRYEKDRQARMRTRTVLSPFFSLLFHSGITFSRA